MGVLPGQNNEVTIWQGSAVISNYTDSADILIMRDRNG